MKRIHTLFLPFLIVIAIAGCNGDKDEKEHIEEELFVSAAASLTGALDELKENFEKEHGITLKYNFGGSGKLAQQIKQGAPVDVFISANENWMENLIEEGFVEENTKKAVTGNQLVLITREDTPINYNSFQEIEKKTVEQIAIGNPESVPAGEYAKTVLKHIDKWDELESKFVYAQDVRQVLTYVETGNAELGFVYKSDILTSNEVKILAESDPSLHDSIMYPGAVMKNSSKKKEGEEFLQFLLSATGQKVLKKYGFTNSTGDK